MLLSGFEEKNSSEVNDKIKGNLKQAVDEAITSVREISANISPHILNNFRFKGCHGIIYSKIASG